MPASNIELYHMQDARNNFDAMRPAPVYADANQYMGQCQNLHVSRNCYYGYHYPKTSLENNATNTDCEMMDATTSDRIATTLPNSRKRVAEDGDHQQSKRFKEELQIKKTNEPETNEIVEKNTEDLLESLYWNIHGGNIFSNYCSDI